MFDRDNIFITVGIQIAKATVVLVLSGVLILPLYGEIARIGNESVDRQNIIALANTSAPQVTQARTRLTNATAHMQTIDTALISLDHIDGFIVAMEELAVATAVTETGLSFGSIVPVTNSAEIQSLTRVPFTVAITGTLDAITAYVRTFEKLPYFAGIEKIAVDAIGGGSVSTSARAQLSGFLITQ